MRIERISADEGEVLRRLRVVALTDSPTAFGATLDETRARPAEAWAERAGAAATGDDQAFWFARHADREVGLVGAFRDGPGDAQLISMWVDPAHRRTGVARRLVDRVVGWARDAGAPAVTLRLETGNVAARRLYEGTGFEPTGVVQPHTSRPGLSEATMRLDLDPPEDA